MHFLFTNGLTGLSFDKLIWLVSVKQCKLQKFKESNRLIISGSPSNYQNGDQRMENTKSDEAIRIIATI